MDLKEHAHLYLRSRVEYETAKKETARLEKEWRQTEKDMIDAMLDKKESFFRIHGTELSFGLSEHFGISVTQDNSDSVRAWLVETEGDDGPFLVEIPSKPAIAEHVKKLVATNRLRGNEDSEGIPEFLKLKTRPTLSCRGR